MALRFKIQLMVVADDDQPRFFDELFVFDKDNERLEQLGLTLAEAKAVLLAVQRQVLDGQIAAFLASRRPCQTCGRGRGLKDRKTSSFGRYSPNWSQPPTPPLSMSVWRAGLQQSAGGVAARARRTRTPIPGEQVVVPSSHTG
jgi:hypothetical protein